MAEIMYQVGWRKTNIIIEMIKLYLKKKNIYIYIYKQLTYSHQLVIKSLASNLVPAGLGPTQLIHLKSR